MSKKSYPALKLRPIGEMVIIPLSSGDVARFNSGIGQDSLRDPT